MDAVFGENQFKAQITWQRISAHSDSKTFGNVCDYILFYGGGNIHTDDIRVPLTGEQVERLYRYQDERGRYSSGDLTAKGLTGGGYFYAFHGHQGPWRYPEYQMRKLEQDNRIHYPKKSGAVPRFKRYLSEHKGQVPPKPLDRYSPCPIAIQRARRLPHAKTTRPAGAHHPRQQQRGRYCSRPVLWLRHRLRSRRQARPPVGRD